MDKRLSMNKIYEMRIKHDLNLFMKQLNNYKEKNKNKTVFFSDMIFERQRINTIILYIDAIIYMLKILNSYL